GELQGREDVAAAAGAGRGRRRRRQGAAAPAVSLRPGHAVMGPPGGARDRRRLFRAGRRPGPLSRRRAEHSGGVRLLRSLRRTPGGDRGVRRRFHVLRGVVLAAGPAPLGGDGGPFPETWRHVVPGGNPPVRRGLRRSNGGPRAAGALSLLLR